MRFFGSILSISTLRKKVIERDLRKLNWFNKIFLWINYSFIVALFGSYFARYISPVTFWPLAFFGLAYPIILIGNIFFIVFWSLQFRWLGIFSAITILIGLRSFFGYVQFSGSTKATNLQNGFRVMSYNCMLFDLYNWSDDNNSKSRESIFSMLEKENPDILCLQEYFTSENPKSFANTRTLTERLKSKNLHIAYTTTLRETDHWGVATFTRFPILRRGKIEFETKTNNICIFSDLIIGKDTVRVYNVHLQSIQFRHEDYDFVDKVLTNKSNEEIEHSKNILRRLKRGFLKRAKQAELVAESIKNCPYKIIVCGDFNDTPSSYAYETMRANLKDAFIEAGSGFEKTYRGKMPAFRIDYILHSKEFKTLEYRKIQQNLTDHFPVTAILR